MFVAIRCGTTRACEQAMGGETVPSCGRPVERAPRLASRLAACPSPVVSFRMGLIRHAMEYQSKETSRITCPLSKKIVWGKKGMIELLQSKIEEK